MRSTGWVLFCAAGVTALGCSGAPSPEASPSPIKVIAKRPVVSIAPPMSSESVVEPTSPPPPLTPAPPLKAPSPMPLPPLGVLCAVRGTNEPFPDSCAERAFVAHAKRDRDRPIARVGPSDIDITWGFFESKGRSWVHIDSNGFTLEGFVDTTTELFALKTDVEAVEGHVWLKHDSAVTVRAKGHGIVVSLQKDLPGTEAFEAATSCESVRYDLPPAPPTPLVAPTAPPSSSMQEAAPKGRTLSLSFTPGGPSHRISARKGEELPLDLSIAEERDGYSRVLFETDHARFNVWVPKREIVVDGAGFGAGGLRLCGGATDNFGEALFEVTSDSPVTVGASPTSNATTEGLKIAQGTTFATREHQAGYVRILPVGGAIYPPNNQSFWLPEAIVKELKR